MEGRRVQEDQHRHLLAHLGTRQGRQEGMVIHAIFSILSIGVSRFVFKLYSFRLFNAVKIS